jgi:hypothetical protein
MNSTPPGNYVSPGYAPGDGTGVVEYDMTADLQNKCVSYYP